MHWTRRTLLKSFGFGAGAALFVPLLRQLHAQDKPLSAPKRVVIFVEGNGIEAKSFLSPGINASLQRPEHGGADDLETLRYIHHGYKNDAPVVVEGEDAKLHEARSLSGLSTDMSARAAVVLGLSSKISMGGHSAMHGALSCTPTHSGVPGGVTIDAYLAGLKSVRGETPFDALRLGNAGGPFNYKVCAQARSSSLSIIEEPETAFNVLFGSVAEGAGQREFQKRNDLLDFALEDTKVMMREFKGSAHEYEKLQSYMESLDTLIKRQNILSTKSGELRDLAPTPSALYTSEAPMDRMQAQIDLARTALIGNLTNVVVLSGGAGGPAYDMRYLTLKEHYEDKKVIAGHVMRHQAERGNTTQLEVLYAVTRRYVDMLAELARDLANTPELTGEGTMLDNTLILYTSGNGEKHHAYAEEWPMLMIGGENLGFKTDGRAVVYPNHTKAANRQVSNVFNSLGQMAGEEIEEFGLKHDNTRIKKGTLSEIWSA